jgi:hypothetical protein
MKTLKTFIPAIIALGLALVWHACTKKDSTNPDDFFEKQNDLAFFKATNGDLAKVDFLDKTMDRFRILDSRHHFANSLQAKYGEAKWDLTMVVKNKDGLYTLITPFINSNDSVTGLLFSYFSNNAHKTVFTVYDKENYKAYFKEEGSGNATNINRSSIAGMFDNFSKMNKAQKEIASGKTVPRSSITVYHCWRYYWSGGGSDPTVGASTWQCSVTVIDVGDWQEVQPPDDPTGPSGGGGAGTRWVYEELPHPNQDIIDSLQGYPCAQEILGRMPNLDDFTDALLNKIFDVSPNVNVIFKADSDGLLGDDNGGTAERYTQNGKLYIKILLNPSMMENASQEFTLAVMLHESIHAYYKFEMAKYEAGIVDSFYIKSNFPKLWQYRNETGGASGEHREMSEGIMNNIADALKVFNSYLDPSVRRALALNGLHKTPYWRSLSDTNNIKLTWDVARYGDSTAAATVNLHKCRY